jgi:hypothetical protein
MKLVILGHGQIGKTTLLHAMQYLLDSNLLQVCSLSRKRGEEGGERKGKREERMGKEGRERKRDRKRSVCVRRLEEKGREDIEEERRRE